MPVARNGTFHAEMHPTLEPEQIGLKDAKYGRQAGIVWNL